MTEQNARMNVETRKYNSLRLKSHCVGPRTAFAQVALGPPPLQ